MKTFYNPNKTRSLVFVIPPSTLNMRTHGSICHSVNDGQKSQNEEGKTESEAVE